MFKFLKEKISGWAKKISGEGKEEVEEEKTQKILEKKSKKKKPAEKKLKKKSEHKKKEKTEEEYFDKIEDKEKEVVLPMEFNAGLQKFEPDLEKIKEDAEKFEEEKESSKKGFFQRIREGISKTKISEEDFENYGQELEMVLIENNVALEVAEKIVSELKDKIVGKDLIKKEIEAYVKETFKEIIWDVLIEPFEVIEKIREKSESPFVILFCGVNGSGKTTTISKISDYFNRNKISSVLAAGDTFRAASIEQLKKHGEKLGVKVIAHEYGSDPAAVGFDAISYAKKQGIKCVLIDTAGRMHTAKNLLREMEKIVRVCKPDLKIFIGESITGNDAIEQVRSFDETIGIDGIILSKADVDEKGGTALSVGYVTRKPILFLGTGQGYKDIQSFRKDKFIESLGL